MCVLLRDENVAGWKITPAPVSFGLPMKPLMLMTVMQFGKMRVIMGEGRVPVRVSMRLLKNRLSVMSVVVMFFVPMNVVVF